MSAAAERHIALCLHSAREARVVHGRAESRERLAVVTFIDEALRQQWSWSRIGEALGVTDTAARRYYQRNRRKIRSV